MISVEVFYGDSLIKGFVIQGHAGAAPKGEDLVCASVSAIAQTAVLGLDYQLEGQFAWKIEDEGYMECWLPDDLSPVKQEKAEIILRTLELGLLSIRKSYGQYLKVSKRRWTECCSK